MKHTEKLLNKFIAILTLVTIFLGVSTAKSQIILTKALDFDGDGKADPVIFRPSENTWWSARSSGGFSVVSFGDAALDSPVPGDYDGDGKGDIAIWRESDGTFWVLQSFSNTFAVKQFGQVGDEPVARDYDGDGKTDCAVIRRESNYLIWYILQSSDNAFISYQFGLYQSGVKTDYPAPGDYDGDGRFDLAVYTEKSDGYYRFWINQSTAGLAVIDFGMSGDLSVPGDYDGDGKTDIAIARWKYKQGDQFEWWILKSSNWASLNVKLP